MPLFWYTHQSTQSAMSIKFPQNIFVIYQISRFVNINRSISSKLFVKKYVISNFLWKFETCVIGAYTYHIDGVHELKCFNCTNFWLWILIIKNICFKSWKHKLPKTVKRFILNWVQKNHSTNTLWKIKCVHSHSIKNVIRILYLCVSNSGWSMTV